MEPFFRSEHFSEFLANLKCGYDFSQVAAKKYSETVQEKLQECLQKGELNSFGRIQSLFGNNDNMDVEDNLDAQNLEGVESDSKITKLVNESTKFNVSMKKHKFNNDEGNFTGKTLARKKVNRMKRRGQMKTSTVAPNQKRIKKTKVSF